MSLSSRSMLQHHLYEDIDVKRHYYFLLRIHGIILSPLLEKYLSHLTHTLFWDVFSFVTLTFFWWLFSFELLSGFGPLNGVPGACRAAHVDSDSDTPRAAMDHGGWAPTKMAGGGFGRNIRKMQLLFEKCPHYILFFVVRGGDKMKFIQE